MFSVVLTGCTAMYQISDQTRLFFKQTPGEQSEYRIIVKLSSGKWITMENGTTWFGTMRGEKFLIGYADTSSQESLWDNTSYKELLDTIPSSDIRSLVINKDVSVITRNGASYDAKSGMWELLPAGDTAWTWHAYDATKNYTKGDEDFRVQVDAAVPENDIREMDLSGSNTLGTILLTWLGIEIGIAVGVVIWFYASQY